MTWPMPTPTEAPSEASRIALDFTARIARQANSRSASVAAEAGSPAASRQRDGSSPVALPSLSSPDASIASRACISSPPEIGRVSTPPTAGAATSSSRRFFFAVRISSASVVERRRHDHLGEDVVDRLGHRRRSPGGWSR